MNLKERADLVDTIGTALSRGEHTLDVLPGLFKQLLEEGAWREFKTKMGKHITYSRFEDFVAEKPLAGLGSKMELVADIISRDTEAKDLLDKELKNPPSLHRAVYNVHGVDRPSGNTEARALRVLREKRPDLHTRVLACEISPHRAMVQAGFRPRTVTVNIDNPKSAASLVKKASPEFLDELRRLL